jgi:hypothetical protein
MRSISAIADSEATGYPSHLLSISRMRIQAAAVPRSPYKHRFCREPVNLPSAIGKHGREQSRVGD